MRRLHRILIGTRRGVGLGLIGFLTFAVAGAGIQDWTESRNRERYPSPGRLVDVGGHRLHLHCTGSGSPTVVLEAGLSGWSQDWVALQPLLDDLRMVCSYDRAGYGWSDEAPSPRAGLAAVEDLRNALAAGGVQAPRVFVGHSLGGALVQLYAQRYPGDVSGLVLIDSLQRDQDRAMNPQTHRSYVGGLRRLTRMGAVAAEFGLMRAAGVPASIIVDRLPVEKRAAAKANGFRSSAFRSLRDEFAEVDSVLAALRQGKQSLAVPVAIVGTRAIRDFPPGWDSPEMRAVWLRGQRRLGAEFGVAPTIVSGAGHYLQIERPYVIAQLIEWIAVRAVDEHTGPILPLASK